MVKNNCLVGKSYEKVKEVLHSIGSDVEVKPSNYNGYRYIIAKFKFHYNVYLFRAGKCICVDWMDIDEKKVKELTLVKIGSLIKRAKKKELKKAAEEFAAVVEKS